MATTLQEKPLMSDTMARRRFAGIFQQQPARTEAEREEAARLLEEARLALIGNNREAFDIACRGLGC